LRQNRVQLRGLAVLLIALLVAGFVALPAKWAEAYATPTAEDVSSLGTTCGGCHARDPLLGVTLMGPDEIPAGGSATYRITVLGGPGQFTLPYNTTQAQVDTAHYDTVMRGAYGFAALLLDDDGENVGNVTPRSHAGPSVANQFEITVIAPNVSGQVVHLRVAGVPANGNADDSAGASVLALILVHTLGAVARRAQKKEGPRP
jgi:hypothetical protein